MPAWASGDDAGSVREEAAPYKEMTPRQRLAILASACRAATRLLLSRDDHRRVLEHVDPLPESTIMALARLRRSRARRQA